MNVVNWFVHVIIYMTHTLVFKLWKMRKNEYKKKKIFFFKGLALCVLVEEKSDICFPNYLLEK